MSENKRQFKLEYGSPKVHSKLLDDPDLGIDETEQIAKAGHKEHLDRLQHHNSWSVRNEVANQGHKDHLDKLVHDPDERVRGEVLQHGYKKHLDILKNDSDSGISDEARYQLR
jgi:hypothetical protein